MRIKMIWIRRITRMRGILIRMKIRIIRKGKIGRRKNKDKEEEEERRLEGG